jgi:N-methylhydantoinase B
MAVGGGAGPRRGGRGCVRDNRAVSDELFLRATFGRYKFAPWGVAGGRDGSRNEVRIYSAEGEETVLGKCARYRLDGALARLVTGTGGGWGDPRERSVEDVLADVRDVYVSVEQAARDYSVVLDSETLELVETRATPSAAA